jgi:hypothetical protein
VGVIIGNSGPVEVGVGVGVGVSVGVSVLVGVFVGVSVGVSLGVLVGVSVFVGVSVGVSVGVGVGVEGPHSLTVVSLIIVAFVDTTVPSSAQGCNPPSNNTVPPGAIPVIIIAALVQSL